jgi:hypothetical protein
MNRPFPGMDPYLEDNAYWQSFQHHLAEELMTLLNAQLDPRYFADVEVRAQVDELAIIRQSAIQPDVGVIETSAERGEPAAQASTLVAPLQRIALPSPQERLRTVQIRLSSDQTLVTSIEILSPTNKRGRGLDQYRQKRSQILHSACHLVELDLLRRGERPGWELEDLPAGSAYVCLVNRARSDAVRISEIWPVPLASPLPILPIPLLAPDPDCPLELGVALDHIYQRARYGQRLNYRAPPPPPELSSSEAAWLVTRLAQHGLR